MSRVTVVDLRQEYTAAGTPISVIGSSGAEIAQVTVNGIADPFEAYDEFTAPRHAVPAMSWPTSPSPTPAPSS